MSENKKVSTLFSKLILIFNLIFIIKDNNNHHLCYGAIIKWNNNTLDMDFLNPFGWENNIVPSNDDDAVIDINDILVVGLENEIHINSLLLESNSRMASIQPFTTRDNLTIGINSFFLSKYTKARLISNYGKFNGYYPTSSLQDTIVNNFGNAQVNFINSSDMITVIESPSYFYQTSQMIIDNSNAFFYNTSSINLYDQSKSKYSSSSIRHISQSHINLYNNSEFIIDNSTLFITNGNQIILNDQSIFTSIKSDIVIQNENSILKILPSSSPSSSSSNSSSLKNIEFNYTNLYSTDGAEILINRNLWFFNSILISNGLNSKSTITNGDINIIDLSIIYSNDGGEINLKNNLNSIKNSIMVTQGGGKINLYNMITATNVSMEISENGSLLNLKPFSTMDLNGGSKIKISNGAHHYISENSFLNLTNSELLIDKNGNLFQNGPIFLNIGNKFENRFKFYLSSNILTTLPLSSTSTSTTPIPTPTATINNNNTLKNSNFINSLINSGSIFINNKNLKSLLKQKIQINIPIINNGTIMVESNCYFSKYHQNNNNSRLIIKKDSTIDSNEHIHLKAGKIYGNGRINTSMIHDFGELGSRNETSILNITGDYSLSSNGLVVIFINSLNDFTQIHINETAILRGDIEIIISNKISTNKLTQLEVVNYHDLDKNSITFRKVRFKTYDPDTSLESNGHDCARSVSTDRSFSVVLIDCQSPISTGVVIGIVCSIVFIVIVVSTSYHFRKSISKRLKKSVISIKLKKTNKNNNNNQENNEENENIANENVTNNEIVSNNENVIN